MIFTWSVTTVNRFTNIYDEGVAQVRTVTYIQTGGTSVRLVGGVYRCAIGSRLPRFKSNEPSGTVDSIFSGDGYSGMWFMERA